MAISPRRRLFVEYYLGEAKGNSAEAARLAGYADSDARNQGYRLRQDPEVAALIQERLDDAAMSADEIMLRLAEHGRASLEPFFDIAADGTVSLNFEKARAAGKLHLLKAYSDSPKTGIQVELVDCQAALALLGKYRCIEKRALEIKHSGTISTGEAADLTGLSDEELKQLEDLLIKAASTAASTSGAVTEELN